MKKPKTVPVFRQEIFRRVMPIASFPFPDTNFFCIAGLPDSDSWILTPDP